MIQVFGLIFLVLEQLVVLGETTSNANYPMFNFIISYIKFAVTNLYKNKFEVLSIY